MKILITTGIFPPDIGGPATYVSKVSDELVAKGHEVEVIAYSDMKTNDKKDFNVYRVVRSKNVFWRYFKYFVTVLKRCGWADIIYTQDSVSAGLPTVLANIFWRKKIILKVVGDFAWEQAQNQYGLRDDLDTFQHQKYNNKIEFWRAIEHFVASKAFKIIVPSQYLKNIVECWGQPKNKIKIIYNAFEEPAQIDDVDMPDGDVIFTAGRLVAWKGIDTLIKIMPNLLKENSNFRLMIIGDGPEKENLVKLISKLGLEEKVLFMGRQPREKLLGYIKKSKMFVLNSSYEGLSHLILEAIWTGIPVAVSRVGGNPEIVLDGDNGTLFTYDDKQEIINSILNNYKNLQNGSNNQLNEKFSFSNLIESTINTLKSAV